MGCRTVMAHNHARTHARTHALHRDSMASMGGTKGEKRGREGEKGGREGEGGREREGEGEGRKQSLKSNSVESYNFSLPL